jgi:hypothetical protein
MRATSRALLRALVLISQHARDPAALGAELNWTCTVRSRKSLDDWFVGDRAFKGPGTVCALHSGPVSELIQDKTLTSGMKRNGRLRDETFLIVMSASDSRIYWSYSSPVPDNSVQTWVKPSWKQMSWPLVTDPTKDKRFYVSVKMVKNFPTPTSAHR